ncbi:MAG TPA: FAD-dependent oxidoreductase [Rhizomicrobium sp.]|nr:FAD-dependent oxidoreductase [Rhizomicrobium sp.]
MKAIICGAGIAGLSCAWWLARDGWDVMLLEKTQSLRGGGYMLDFFGSGWDVAERMGLVPALRALRYPVKEVCWIDGQVRTQAILDVRLIADLLQGRYANVLRGDLERILFDAQPPGIDLRFDTSIATIETDKDAVALRLTSGAIERADLLVGADGIHSIVREKMFGAEKKYLRFLGYQTAAFVFDDPRLAEQLGDEFKLMTVPGREVGFYALRGGRIASFFVHKTRSAQLPANPLEELWRVYRDLGWLVPQSLKAAERLPGIYYDVVAQVEMPQWSRRHVVLIGDAAMAVSLLAGQGASMGMASAYCLAEALRAEKSVDKALQKYERMLKAPIKAKQRAGRQTANWIVPPTSFHIFLRNAVMRLGALPGGRTLLAKMFLSGSESVIPG